MNIARPGDTGWCITRYACLLPRPTPGTHSSIDRLRLSRPGCLVPRQGGLPVRLAERQRQRVTYKLAVLTHKVQTTATPTYLSELVQTHAPLRGLRALRSSDAPTRRSSHTHGTGPSRFFCCCSIHLDVTLCENILTFKRHLKTHLFS